jgi:outer membrane protein assembly factor BamB
LFNLTSVLGRKYHGREGKGIMRDFAGQTSEKGPHFNLSQALAIASVVLALVGCQEKSREQTPQKTTYRLTVTRPEGVEGFPDAGTYTYDPGQTVDYLYRAHEDFSDLTVMLDGSAVAASGSILMNANHSLATASIRRVLWKYYVDAAVYYSCPAIGDDGTIYFGTGIYLGPPYNQWRPGAFYALGSDGLLKWSYPTGTSLFSPVIGPDGTIYVQDHLNTVYAFTPGGRVKWTYKDYVHEFHRDMGQRTPAIGVDGTVYIGVDGLYAVHPGTGQRLWHFAHPIYPYRECIASPVIGRDGVIYVTIGEDMLFAVYPDGRQKWVYAFTNEWEMSFTSPAIDRDGTIYLGVEGGPNDPEPSHVYAVRPDGTLKWKYTVDGGRPVRASPAIGSDGSVYVATKAGGSDVTSLLLCLSPDGRKTWEYKIERVHAQTPDDSYSSPSVGADGIIYFGAETGILYAVRPDGTLAWQQQLRYGINWSSPAIVEDGTIYIGTLDGDDYQGYLYALISTSQGYASSPWPRFRHDRKNTGRY